MIEELLERYPDPARLALVLRNRPEVRRRPETVAALIDRAAEIRGWDLDVCTGLASLAVDLAREIEGVEGAGLKARALAELGNAYRLAERLGEAREVFAEAEALLEEPIPARRLAEIYFLLGAFYRDLREYAPAAAAEQAAVSIFGQIGEIHEETRALILLGQLLTAMKQFTAAQKQLLVAIKRLTSDPWDPDLLVCACLNVAYLYTEWAGSRSAARREITLDAALTTLKHARLLVEEHAHDRRRLEFDWLYGRLLHRRGRHEEARSTLEGLAERYYAASFPLTGTLVALDLAECLLKLERLDEARALAIRCESLFRGAGLPANVTRAFRIMALADTLRAACKGLKLTCDFRSLVSVSDS